VNPEGIHQGNVYIPTNPEYYPQVTGDIVVYDGLTPIAIYPITIQTTYGIAHSFSWSNTTESLTIVVNASQTFEMGDNPLLEGQVHADVYKNDSFYSQLTFTRQDLLRSSIFSLIFTPIQKGEYRLEVYFDDGYMPEEELLAEIIFSTAENNFPKNDHLSGDEMGLSIGLIAGFIAIPGSGLYITAKKKSLKRIT
jgi:hypothetical protein